MTAFMHREYVIRCDEKGCRQSVTGSVIETRAQVRKAAARRGWTHVRSSAGRRFDGDYCPDHKPMEQP